ncbi:MAG: hypothetical protein HRU15_03820 [Planctomycetes bacterium]|nr:hypothetical protein [Planctomycetota bacterium]
MKKSSLCVSGRHDWFTSSGFNTIQMPLALIFVCSLISSCGVNTAASGAIGLYTVTARNDTQDLTFVTAGTNPDVIIPIIVNDTIQVMTGISYRGSGHSALPFNYDPTVTPWDPDSGLSLNINGGNPHFPAAGFPDASDMSGVVTDNHLLVGFDDPSLIELTYDPSTDAHGVDWFAYTPLGINGGSDTAYVIVRFVMITEDEYEPDDFIQFARDITPYVTNNNFGENYSESHNSDYPNLDDRRVTAFRTIGSGDNFSIRGDRDWFVLTLPTNVADHAIEIKTIIPKVLTYANRNSPTSLENELGVVLIEETSGQAPARNNGPPEYRYTQNTDFIPFLPYYSVVPGFVNINHLFQNQRQNHEPGLPSPLWFKWPLDLAAGFLSPAQGGSSTGRVFIRINPTARLPNGIAFGIDRYYMGDYRIDFKLIHKEFTIGFP